MTRKWPRMGQQYHDRESSQGRHQVIPAVDAATVVQGIERLLLPLVVISVPQLMFCSGASAQPAETSRLDLQLFAQAADPQAPTPDAPSPETSPWMVAPVFNADPKLGAAIGALGGYVHYFDEKSRPSIFALSAQYSNTESIIAGAMAKTSFDEDNQRLLAGLAYGYVKNDYDDYLGTGESLRSNGEVKALIARYLKRITGAWFMGAQGLYQNFDITGETESDELMLDELGVEPYKSGGVGLVVYHDSRDNDNSPTGGWVFNLNNMAYRESLGSENNFDIYRIDYKVFFKHGPGHVVAVRQLNHWTHLAPTVTRAPVQLRGYKIGQYNSDYMSSVEVEERLRLAERWTATLFTGVACLYGDEARCFDKDDLYPTLGAGIQFVLKKKEGIVMNMEFADGSGESYGLYLKMGYAF